jgi:hypothetical protein
MQWEELSRALQGKYGEGLSEFDIEEEFEEHEDDEEEGE